MTEYLIACDLGTGGMKATLYDRALSPVAETFAAYPTYYPAPEWHEQSISDWWNALVFCTHDLIRMSGAEPQSIRGIALSGASLVAVPIGKDGLPLCERVPIWSDKRAVREAEAFFLKTSSNTWYRATGNGFPAACYPLFKLLWMKQHLPDIYERTAFTLGSKDYLNFRMTGIAATDHSYASGTGAYHLTERRMMPELMREAGVREELFLPPVPPHTPVGALTKEAAEQMGLARGTFVFCGGVDNACMALGTVGTQKNRAYVSLGTSSWIPVNAEKPVLDERTRPYTFAHIEKNLYTSAYSVFSGGSSLEWAKNTLLGDGASYEALTALALSSPAGARGVMFHPRARRRDHAGMAASTPSADSSDCTSGRRRRTSPAPPLRASPSISKTALTCSAHSAGSTRPSSFAAAGAGTMPGCRCSPISSGAASCGRTSGALPPRWAQRNAPRADWAGTTAIRQCPFATRWSTKPRPTLIMRHGTQSCLLSFKR